MAVAGAAVLMLTLAPAALSAQDPRETLAPGNDPWSEASLNVDLLKNTPNDAPFAGSFTSDLAFKGDYAIAGSYEGFQVYDVSDPANPVKKHTFICPGGQGDVSVYGNLLFMSVEETRGRIDCAASPTPTAATRFRGVRIFDITDLANPVQLPGVQTCRGSHTHTLVTDPNDPANVYVYNSGTSSVRSSTELAGCVNQSSNTNTPVTTGNPTQWRIDVIKVPLAAPQTAGIVSQPRIFQVGDVYNGLQNTLSGTQHPSGTAYSPVPNTNTCHDITAYPALGIAAGACQGNGILLDISDPANPVRTAAVSDPNFSYWHSATLSNDGSKVIFTDEWGGGTSERCRATDRPEWGANAIYEIKGGQLEFASYWKIPAVQAGQNCVAHNGSLVPVPGRDVFVQAWYQGGMTVLDFTDAKNPREIAYYDRGPLVGTIGGFWSTYWYNGNVFGTEIKRGFDAFGLKTSEELSANELAAARQVRSSDFNAQMQTPIVWPATRELVGAYFEQATDGGVLTGNLLMQVDRQLAQGDKQIAKGNNLSAKDNFTNAGRKAGEAGAADLSEALLRFAGSLGA